MREKIKNPIKIAAAFVGTHLLCCAPMFMPAAFGFAISGLYASALSLTAIAAVYTASYIFYKYKKTDPLQQPKCGHDHHPEANTYLKSKPFKNASFITAGIFLGAAFNQLSANDHNHGIDHQHETSHQHKMSNVQTFVPLKPINSSRLIAAQVKPNPWAYKF